MKEELQGKLVEILTSIQSAAGKASDFAMTELPDIAQSYIVYGRAVSTTAVVVGLLGFAWLIYSLRKRAYHSRMYWETSGKEESAHRASSDGWMLSCFAAGVVSFFGLLASQGFFLVWFAPKVWLLKEIARMLK